MKDITVQWYGPYTSLDDIRDNYEGPGIYCISGLCSKQRKSRPQYIGISTTDVAERLSDYWHTHKAVKDSGKCFYIGYIRANQDIKYRLDLLENTLIYFIKPSLNKLLKDRPPLVSVRIISQWFFPSSGNIRKSAPKNFLFELPHTLIWYAHKEEFVCS